MQRIAATIACNLCEGREVTVLSRRSRSGKPLRTVACTACGLVWSDPRPHDTRQFYVEDYRIAYKKTFRPKPKHVLRAGGVALSRLEKVRPLLRGRMSILDVGSGGGEFAYLLRSLGHDVLGVEPNRGYAEYAAAQYGLDIAGGFIGDVPLEKRHFDLITMWHVLEHTEDPGAILRQLREALAPHGRLVVEVPNVEATCQSPRSSFHEAHLYGFNELTFERLAAKAGLRRLYIEIAGDGGTLTAAFAASADAPSEVRLPGNHQRVSAIVRAHTPLRHALSPNPWMRAARRLRRALAERDVLRRERLTGKTLLDRLYSGALGKGADRDLRPRWHWIAGAYVLAIALEEALLDRKVPLGNISAGEAFAAYVLVQCGLVAGLVWLHYRGTGSRGAMVRAAGWAAPLFAIPAVC